LVRDNPILSSERVLHKGYDRKGSAAERKKNIPALILKRLDAKLI
jgi:hypothetical protein